MLHDAGVEVIAGLLTRLMSILRVVEQRLVRLWRVLVKLTCASVTAAVIVAYLARSIFVRLAFRARLRWLILIADLRDLVDQDNLCQLRSVLQTLKFSVEELGSRLDDLIDKHRLLGDVVTGGGRARPKRVWIVVPAELVHKAHLASQIETLSI